MRYWIYWNDLVQGPFELDELSTLKALSEDLPVCLEDRADWLPACRIADLAPIIEERRSARMPPPPPPPPPIGKPAADPLQGEFFTEAPNQKWLFPNSDPSKGPFAFEGTQLELKTVFSDVSFTAPFRFSRSPEVEPRPLTGSILTLERKEEDRTIIADIFPSRESPVPELQHDVNEPASAPRISLELYPDVPEPSEKGDFETPFYRPAKVSATSELPPLQVSPNRDRSSLRLAGWVVGIFTPLLLVGVLGHKWFDRATSRSAIREVKESTPSVHSIRLPDEHIALPTPFPKMELPKKAELKTMVPIKQKKQKVLQPARVPTVLVSVPTQTPVVPLVSLARLKEVPPDSWKDRQQEAIALVQAKKISRIHETVGERAEAMVQSQSGQKMTWDALQVAGPLYRVSLILSAAAGTGKAESLRLYPFVADLKHQRVTTDDASTAADFLRAKKKIVTQLTESQPLAQPQPSIRQDPTPLSKVESPAPSQPSKNEIPDVWRDRYNEAITLTTNKKLSATGQTLGERAGIMLEGMHDKELLYAADTGQRLYLPDKIAWSALREKGPAYRVFLGFSGDQANGERIQSQSYQFQADLEHHTVLTDDAASAADFLEVKTPLVHQRDARAADIQNVLSAVDLLNKQLMRAIIVKDSRKNRLEEKNISAAIATAMQRFQRAVIYFRTKYPDTMLQNVAQAYSFTKLLKDHV